MTKLPITGHLLQGGRPLGVMLIIASTLFFSTAGVFTKGVSADAWSVIFWRGVFAALLGILYLGMISKLRTKMRRMRRVGWCLAFIYASGTAAFIPAFKMTSIANVALIWSSAPLLAGLALVQTDRVVWLCSGNIAGCSWNAGGCLGVLWQCQPCW